MAKPNTFHIGDRCELLGFRRSDNVVLRRVQLSYFVESGFTNVPRDRSPIDRQSLADAAQPLYLSLDDQQKRRFGKELIDLSHSSDND